MCSMCSVLATVHEICLKLHDDSFISKLLYLPFLNTTDQLGE
jgi:hypothetical protein